jgi:hypothetical protein
MCGGTINALGYSQLENGRYFPIILMLCLSCGAPARHAPGECVILEGYINTIKILSLVTLVLLDPK